MTTENTDRDTALSVVYRDLCHADLALSAAQKDLLTLGWTTASGDLTDAIAQVHDLLHDLAVYAGSTGGDQ